MTRCERRELCAARSWDGEAEEARQTASLHLRPSLHRSASPSLACSPVLTPAPSLCAPHASILRYHPCSPVSSDHLSPDCPLYRWSRATSRSRPNSKLVRTPQPSSTLQPRCVTSEVWVCGCRAPPLCLASAPHSLRSAPLLYAVLPHAHVHSPVSAPHLSPDCPLRGGPPTPRMRMCPCYSIVSVPYDA